MWTNDLVERLESYVAAKNWYIVNFRDATVCGVEPANPEGEGAAIYVKGISYPMPLKGIDLNEFKVKMISMPVHDWHKHDPVNPANNNGKFDTFFEHLKEKAVALAPDYPNVSNVNHWEHLWALTSSLEGTDGANQDCHKIIDKLRERLGMSKMDVVELWDELKKESTCLPGPTT